MSIGATLTETMNPTTETPAAAADGAQPDAGAPPTTDVLVPLETQFAELQARHAEVSDAYLRAKADAENTRRRAEEEMSKARKFAVEAFAESLLPVKDSLEAALATESASAEQIRGGVEVTLKQLAQVFEREKVREINPMGERFDPHLHQAIAAVPADGDPNRVLEVLQKGYALHDRVLRPALVSVSRPKES